MAVILWVWACAAPSLELEAQRSPTGVEARASRPVAEVAAWDGTGRLLQRRWLDPPTDRVALQVPPGAVRVTARAGDRTADAPVSGGTDWAVAVSAPAGSEWRSASADAWIALPGAETVSVAVRASSPVRAATVTWPDGEAAVLAPAPGLPAQAARAVALPATVRVDGATLRLTGQALAPGDLAVDDVVYPVDAEGRPLPAHAADRVVLPPTWRRSWTEGAARGALRPHGWVRVGVRSALPVAVDVRVDTRVCRDGAEDPAFRTPAPDGSPLGAGAVVRLAPGQRTSLVLPVYVADDALPGPREWTVRVSPLSGGPAWVNAARRWTVAPASGWGALGAAALGAAGVAGWSMLLARGRAWLGPPGQAVAIGTLGALGHALGAGAQLAGAGVAAVLGPFAPFLTGIADDAVRAAVLATLLTWYPRPGVVAWSVAVGTLTRAVLLGAFHPIDLVFLGASAALGEGCARAAGLTRPAWLGEARRWQWARLSLGLGVANALTTAGGLALGATVWRLYYAPSYVVALVALPGLLYVAVGCWLAVPLAASLREVAP